MRELIQKFNSWMSSVEPHRIFHKSTFHYKLHDEPKIGAGIFGGTEYGYEWTTYKYTRLGDFMMKMPVLPEMLGKLIYYAITWPLYLVVKLPWMLFRGIFVPAGWL